MLWHGTFIATIKDIITANGGALCELHRVCTTKVYMVQIILS